MATVEHQSRTRHDVKASDVRAGDWTKFSGWKRVHEVRRLAKGRVGLVREDGRMRTEDKLEHYQLVAVYRGVDERETEREET